MKETVRKKLLDEMSENIDNMKQLEIGSEDYLNAAKANNQNAEAAQKLKSIDWMQIIGIGSSIFCTVLTIAASQTSILDTRPVTFVRSLFKK